MESFESTDFVDIQEQKNVGAWGIDGKKKQRLLYDSRVIVVGSDCLAQMILVNLVGLGIGHIHCIDDRVAEPTDKNSFLYYSQDISAKGIKRNELIARKLDKINPNREYFFGITTFEYQAIDRISPTLVIDATNKPLSKAHSLEYCLTRAIPFISASSEPMQGSVSFIRKGDSMPEKSLESALHEEYARLEQGSYTSGVIAGLASEQVRKLIFAIDDNGLDKPLLTGTTLSYRPHNGLNESRKPLKGISILQVGAGAIGNFAALNLALVGIGIIHIVDYDTIESTNLNRSPFLHGKIGKSKARVLSERLREINPSINVIYSRQKFGKRTFKSSKYLNTYDAILGCVDNNRGRYHINKFAIERNMPYIDGGTGHASGRFGLYVPKVNACMDCRYNLMESLSHPEKRGNCPGNLEPAIVIPNIIIGSAMVAELMNLLSGNPTFTKNTFKYDTLVDSRIYEEPVRVIGNCGMNC